MQSNHFGQRTWTRNGGVSNRTQGSSHGSGKIYQYINDNAKRLFLLLKLLSKLRDNLEQITDEPHVRDLEDGSIGVLVDGRNNLAVLHTRKMLDSTRDTSAEIQLRSNVLASLSDLQAVIGESAVDSGARGTDGSTQRVGKGRHESVEFFLGFQTTTTGDDAGGGAEIGTVRGREILRNPFRGRRGLGVNTRNDFCVAAGRFAGLEGGAADGDDFNGVGGLDGQDGISGINGADKGCSFDVSWLRLTYVWTAGIAYCLRSRWP